MQFSEDQIAIRDMTREFIKSEVVPFAAEWDRQASIPKDVVQRAGALGLFGVSMPSEWDGAGADFKSYVLAVEEMAFGDAGFCNMVSATNSYGFKVRDYGTDDLKKRFLSPVAAGEALGCMVLGEPQGGSRGSNLNTGAFC